MSTKAYKMLDMTISCYSLFYHLNITEAETDLGYHTLKQILETNSSHWFAHSFSFIIISNPRSRSKSKSRLSKISKTQPEANLKFSVLYPLNVSPTFSPTDFPFWMSILVRNRVGIGLIGLGQVQ